MGIGRLDRFSHRPSVSHDPSWDGILIIRYPSLLMRILQLRLVPATPHLVRLVSYEYMNRQLVWSALTVSCGQVSRLVAEPTLGILVVCDSKTPSIAFFSLALHYTRQPPSVTYPPANHRLHLDSPTRGKRQWHNQTLAERSFWAFCGSAYDILSDMSSTTQGHPGAHW